MKRMLFVVLILAGAAVAMGLSAFGKVFADTYKVSKDSKLGKAGCAVCHTSAKGGKLNPYGLEIQAAMKAEGTKKVTPAILKKVESGDADKDGKKNVDEIKADSLPGG